MFSTYKLDAVQYDDDAIFAYRSALTEAAKCTGMGSLNIIYSMMLFTHMHQIELWGFPFGLQN